MKRLVPIALLVGCLLCAQSAFAADQPAASGDSASTASSAVAAVRMQESASTQLSLGGGSDLQPGYYIVQRAGTNTRVLDAAGGGTGNGTNVQLHTVNNTPAQLWRVSRDAEGYYTLANAKSGKVLDVRLAKAGNGANVQLYRSNGTKAQKWLAERKGSGYVLKSALDARYVLDCAGGSVDAGTNIRLYKGNGSTAQCFRFADANPQVEAAGRTVADGVYQIATSLSGKAVLDVANGSAAKGANIRLYAANQSTAQRWYVRMGADGFYTLVSLESGMALDVDRGIKLTANVQQYTPNGSDAQKWSISENTDGTYSLASKCNGLRLAVQGAKTANGTNVIVTSSSASAAQKFAFKAVPVLADGYYSFFSKLGQTGYALDVKGNSVAQGARVQLWTANSSPAQRFKLSHLGDGIYSIQAVASGKYLADAGGKVVQQARNGDLADVQKWKVTARPSGVSLENLATGRALAVSGDRAAKSAIVTRGYAGKAAERFRPVRYASMLAQGLYSFRNRASAVALDVKGGSWSAGAGLQLWKANGTNAQKFALVPLGNNSYRIVMALSGTVLEAKTSGAATLRSVQMARSSGSSAQIWTAQLTEEGIVLANKGTGLVLSAANAAAKAGTAANAQADRGTASQAWSLAMTTLNSSDVGQLRKLVASASSASKPKLDARGRSYQLSAGASKQLMNALGKLWNKGRTVGFVLADPGTGVSLAMNADKTIYGASTFKAAYVTYLFQDLIEKGRLRYADIKGTLEQTIVWSNNDAYGSLRNRFGYAGFAKWLSSVGLAGMAGEWYPYTTPRKLELVWAKIYSYERSGGKYVSQWRKMFSHSYQSFINEALRGTKTVYSKPGWMYSSSSMGAIWDDAAIVRGKNGRTYVMSVLTNVNFLTDRAAVKDIVKALDRIHAEMPSQ